jgi:tripartite-type tricarboxylate transporter receptor subunit TctC
MFESVSFSIENNRAGKLRALAVTSSMRSGLLPDVPLVADFLPGFESSPWLGMAAPMDKKRHVWSLVRIGLNTREDRLARLRTSDHERAH